MSNRLTRVPEGRPPALPRWARPLVGPADAVMRLLWSRPRSGSLAVTWVTPATLWLCLVTPLAAGMGLVLLVVDPGGRSPGFTAVLCVVLAGAALLALPVALVGVAQRRRG